MLVQGYISTNGFLEVLNRNSNIIFVVFLILYILYLAGFFFYFVRGSDQENDLSQSKKKVICPFMSE